MEICDIINETDEGYVECLSLMKRLMSFNISFVHSERLRLRLRLVFSTVIADAKIGAVLN